ncbi:MAG: penicillin-binding protein 1C [Flavobacteriales bacterium]|nr:penicillin-binding protein 1C [Flavobacteriales bacterium]
MRRRNKILPWIPAVALIYWFFTCLPDPLFDPQNSTVLYDRDGKLLSATIASDGQWRFPVADSVPEKFKQAILLFEDRHFYHHNGVYLPRLVKALAQNLTSRRVVSGGSTLTMQVARMACGNPPRTMLRKMAEIMMAFRLESQFSKDEILSLYAGHAPFGGNVVGLDAAAWRYFGRKSDQLSWAEAATLAVLPNAPALIFPGKNQEILKEKRDRLLRQLAAEGFIDQETLNLSLLEPLPGKPFPLPAYAPHLLHTCKSKFGEGQRYHTTIDVSVQQTINQLLEQHMVSLRANEVFNGAVVVVETATGNTLAYVGNTDEPDQRHANMVDCVKAPRSTGSILKPFLYTAMLQDGFLLPNTLVADIPVQLDGFAPKNYQETFDGAVPAGRALSRSLNVPSVLMLRDYGYPRFFHLLKESGFSQLNENADHYGLSIILGGGEASLWDITHAYARLGRAAISGTANEVDITAPQLNHRSYLYSGPANDYPVDPLWNPGAAWCTFQALLEVNRPETELGWQAYSGQRPIAWKTGTSFGNRDAWAVGTTPEYVVGVWIGNADGVGRPTLTGVEAAAPLLFRVFEQLPSRTWFRPPYDDLVKVATCRQSGKRAGRYCEEIDSLWVPLAGQRTGACDLHMPIFCNHAGTQRVNMNCAHADEIREIPWFVLPPVQAWYYKSRHPEYLDPPPWAEGCAPEEEHAIGLIYPRGNAAIYLPKNLEGEWEKTVLEATHIDEGATLFWHLNNEFIGETRGIHQMEISPSPGTHLLVITDTLGRTLMRRIEFLPRNEAP